MKPKGKKLLSIDDLIPRITELSDEESLRIFLRRHRRLRTPEAVEKLAEAVNQRLRVDVKAAQRIAEAALAIAQSIGDKRAEALGSRAQANVLWFMNNNQSAVVLYERARLLFEEISDSTEVGRTLSSSIQPLILLGEYDRALAAAERAREIFTQAGDPRRLARLSINFANIYSRQDRLSEALEMYERAYQQLLPFKDAEAIGVVLHNLAVTLILLNDFDRARIAYEKAREFCAQSEMPGLVAQADYNIAYLYYLRGEYSRALEMLSDTRKACEAASDFYHSALCNLDQSEIYLELNLVAEAVEMAQQGFAQFEKLGMPYEAAKCLANLAIATSRQGNPVGALELFGKARDIFVREKNQAWPSLIDLYQAVILYSQGRFFEARRLCNAAVDFFAGSMVPSKEILGRLLLARLALRLREVEAARGQCGLALERLKQLESPHLMYQTKLLLGQVEEAAGRYDAARQAYESSREALETLRSVLRGEELKIAFLKNRLEVYESLVQLCIFRNVSDAGADWEPSPAREAFTNMERAKSRSLRELLFERARPAPAAEPGQSDLVRKIRNLREELNWYYHRIELEQLQPESGSSERIERLQTQLREREKQFMDTLREMPSAEAESAGLHKAPTLSLEEIQAALGPDSTLVEYFRVRDQIVAAVVTARSVQLFSLTLVSRVGSLLRLLQFQMSKFRLGPQYFAAFQKSLLQATEAHLVELYRELIEPLGLKGPHIIFVPHDIVHYLPLHAMYDGNRYLIDQFTVSYAPSASIFTLCSQKLVNVSGPSLILGVPDAEAPFIFGEVQAVANMLPNPELFLGGAASQSVLKEKGPASRLIHIATHGRFREDNPMFSGVRLGDSYLTLYDLYQLRLPVELVTLSGCATGLNVVAAGDELLGLVRGLLTAGAQTLLLTLWDVHDQSTSEFMKSFYGHFLREGDKATALRNAMLELRQQHPHPYYWAPFTLLGKPS